MLQYRTYLECEKKNIEEKVGIALYFIRHVQDKPRELMVMLMLL